MAAPITYPTEADAASAFDSIIDSTNLFRSFAEVPGTLVQPRPGQIDKSVRIDRILLPTEELLELGWVHGIVGVELKRGDNKAGPCIAQAMDYTRSIWTLPGSRFQVALSWVFLWPMESQIGPLASVMAQNRIGTAASNNWTRLELKNGAGALLRVSIDGTIRLGERAGASGTKVGSR